MNKSQKIKISIIALLLGYSCFAQKKPNIVFILTDDQSSIVIDTPKTNGNESRPFGFNGDKYVHTPIIDDLAKNGMIFENAFVSTPVCSASRYSIMTGRYASRCSADLFMKLHPNGKMTRVENNTELEEDRDNLAKLLKGVGYRTGFVGKSHIVDHHLLKKFMKKNPPFKAYDKKADPNDPAVNEAMHYNHKIWAERIKDFGFDYANGIYAANLRELFNDSLNVHNVEWKNKAALEFLDDAKKDEPFFLYYSETIPHGPAPWIKKRGKYPHGLDSNPDFCGEGKDNFDYSHLPNRQSIKQEVKDLGKDVDHAWVTWFDYAVGAVVDKLKEKGVYENTIIVITSDHGNFDHEKSTLYEGGIKVPLTIHWPKGIKPNSKYEGLVQNIDFTPTFLELAGIKKTNEKMDGISLKKILKGSKKDVRDYLYFEIGLARGIRTKDKKYIAVRYDQRSQKIIDEGKMFNGFRGHKSKYPYYIRNGHLGSLAAKAHPDLYFVQNQMFDMSKDPEESVNIFGESNKETKKMKDWLTEVLVTFEKRPFGEFINK